MANTYFQFKHFRVEQDLCAMKVCTDACMLGALAPVKDAQHILDIGTGTGLLALMAAQRSHALIDAVEIDSLAAEQAKRNIKASKWANRIFVHQLALQDFVPAEEGQYDSIISNPPFFVNSLRPQNTGERIAKHTDTLSFAEIISFSVAHLQPKGTLSVLLPPAEQEFFAAEATKKGLYSYRSYVIKDRPNSPVFRIVSFYSFTNQEQPKQEELVIKNPDGTYSSAFRALLKDFYLAF